MKIILIMCVLLCTFGVANGMQQSKRSFVGSSEEFMITRESKRVTSLIQVIMARLRKYTFGSIASPEHASLWLMHSCASGFFCEIFRLVEDHKANVNQLINGVTPLWCVCNAEKRAAGELSPYWTQQAQYDWCKYLLEKGACPDLIEDVKQAPLCVMMKKGNKEMCQLLLEWGAREIGDCSESNVDSELFRYVVGYLNAKPVIDITRWQAPKMVRKVVN